MHCNCPVAEYQGEWVESDFIRLVGPVETDVRAGLFPPLTALVELANAPHPVFARVLHWRVDTSPMRRTVGFALRTLRLYAPREVKRLEWLLSPSGWLDCYDIAGGPLVLAASARPEDAESCALELVRASASIQRRERRRVDAAEFLVAGDPADLESRLGSILERFFAPGAPDRVTLSLESAGRADRYLVVRQPGVGVENTALHPATAERLDLSLSAEFDRQEPEEGVYCLQPRAPHTGRLVVSDARGRVAREGGGHRVHPDALRWSAERALAVLNPPDEGDRAHRIRIVADGIEDVDCRDLSGPLEHLGPALRARGAERIEVVPRYGTPSGRILVGSLHQSGEFQGLCWRWVARERTQSRGTRLRSS